MRKIRPISGPGLETDPADGGWPRDDVPSIVLVYDSSEESQVHLLRVFESDERIRIASHLFNCFRVDARGLGDRPVRPTITVCGSDGKPVGEVDAQKLTRLYSLMEITWRAHARRELSKVIPPLQEALSGLARCEHQIDELAARLVCPDCGGIHEAVTRALDEMSQSAAGHRRAIAALRLRDG